MKKNTLKQVKETLLKYFTECQVKLDYETEGWKVWKAFPKGTDYYISISDTSGVLNIWGIEDELTHISYITLKTLMHIDEDLKLLRGEN